MGSMSLARACVMPTLEVSHSPQVPLVAGHSWKERRAVEEVCAAYARVQEGLNRI
ncbi:BQ5605_C013g07180 [Microbotryum silenes-dioicae]|uniref:BQ5605_C013g07180 protein n=1 Tax=Microbotryum silenes-dioicae TaxID=796604 RepID=A0A2X0LUH9_9BASI|nr:BQ5605_C013g07180 [Microbotryum silenes-dioicae]